MSILNSSPTLSTAPQGLEKSGKTTLVRSIRYFHNKEVVNSRVDWNYLIKPYLLTCVKELLIFAQEQGKVSSKNLRAMTEAAVWRQGDGGGADGFIEEVMVDEGVRELLENLDSYPWADLDASSLYFLHQYKDILAPEFIPTVDHITRAYSNSCGGIEMSTMLENKLNGIEEVKLVDMSGRYLERTKYLPFRLQFDKHVLMAHLISLGDLGRKYLLWRAPPTYTYGEHAFTTLAETMEQLIAAPELNMPPVLLFVFTQPDLLQTQLDRGATLQTPFPDYQGPLTVEDIVVFLQGKLKSTITAAFSNKGVTLKAPEIKFLTVNSHDLADITRLLKTLGESYVFPPPLPTPKEQDT